MKIDLYTKIVLTILTVFVGILVFRDVDFVTKAQANELFICIKSGTII